MVNHLDRKLLRDLRALKSQAIAVALVMACGLDSCKEETDAYEAPFLARGIAILVFDGPGQGEAEYDFPIRGDGQRQG